MLSSFRNCFSKRILLHLCAGSIELVAVSIPDDEPAVINVRYGISHRFGI